MSRQEQINSHQLISLTIILLIGTSIIVGSKTLGPAGRSAWVAVILAILGSIALAFILNALQQRLPGKNLAEYSEIILGKFLGKLLNFFYLSYFIFLFALITDNLTFIYTTLFYVKTPTWFFDLSLYVLCLAAVIGGVTTVGRLAEIASPLMIFFILLTTILALLSPNANFSNLFPLFTEGFWPILKASWQTFAFPFGEMIALAMFLHAFPKKQTTGKPLAIGIMIGGGIYLLTIFRNIVLLGAERLGMEAYPSATVVRLIQLGGFIERTEAIIVIFWVLSIFMKALIVLYAAGLTTAQTFNRKKVGLFWIFIILIAFGVDIYLVNTPFVVAYINNHVYPYMVVLQIVVPAFLLLIAKLRGIKIKEQSA